MLEFVKKLFDSDFMPHGHCYFWRPEIVWLHVSSDALIALAYFCIPVALVILVRRRRDLAFHWMFVLFGLFILACGATHAMSIWTLWHGTYRLEGVIKLITALTSVPTAILLVRLVPKVIKLASPEQLLSANLALAGEVAEQKRVEIEVREVNARLEERVRERTQQLERVNADLRESIEALRKSNKALNQFAYAASHDIQAPLRTVAVYSSLVQKKCAGLVDEKTDVYLRYIVDAAQNMRELTQSLLSYAQIANGADESITTVDCSEVVAKASFALQMMIQMSGGLVTHDELPKVRAIEIHVLQLFQNLIANGIKYCPDLAPRVHISATRENDRWLFCIKDNGMGIEPEYAEKIFGLFKRLHGSRVSGAGVGLALCSRIVDRYGGRIWVESAKGEGARFFFTLPAAEVPTDGGSTTSLGGEVRREHAESRN